MALRQAWAPGVGPGRSAAWLRRSGPFQARAPARVSLVRRVAPQHDLDGLYRFGKRREKKETMARELQVPVVPVRQRRPAQHFEALRFRLPIEHLAIPTTIESHDQRSHERACPLPKARGHAASERDRSGRQPVPQPYTMRTFQRW